MPKNSLLTLVGFIVLLAGTYCPLLRPFGLTNMDLYDLSKPFGIVILLICCVGILGVALKQAQLTSLTAWSSLVLIALVFIAAILKVHHTFSFIPFQSIAGFLTRQIRFKWGWIPLFAGPILTISGIVTTKSGANLLKQ